ncbi:hypothetical protein [Nannocystis punicea]|uniref:Uncharacterized protein n=1 Tax=Nannocystis punicea TaxID=2995304 RepID=A0ABY7HD76_9BACT|nr:hypothetical protein [Nannocystis poenicansa]WAS97222.1 hypothetical protein O0S08_13830 [Nannocystis poenicansa]
MAVDLPSLLHAGAARAAALDFLEARGLAAPDLDSNRTDDVLAARAAEVLTADGILDASTSTAGRELLLNTWARGYLACMLALQGVDTSARRAT